jgi:predicted AlkP superfamily pyrophosphatase or phosphodiesterase
MRLNRVLLAVGLALSGFIATGPAVAEEPRLIVVVSVDQLCQDYLVRFKDNFAPTGFFNQVAATGASYSNCHHQHAMTVTAPGHAVQLTGAYPNTNGIILNDWFDRDLNAMRYCVSDPLVKVVGTTSKKGMSPRSLLVNTVGDQMKLANSKSKVIGVAIKDRASILMTGHQADAAYWLDTNMWVTTEYYRGDLPGCLAQINTKNDIQKYRGKKWELLHPKAKYHNAGPDENAWENPPKGFGSAFPHEILPAGQGDEKQFGDQVLASPFGNDYTLDAARELVVSEQLGQDTVPDLLCINFSSNDYVGHAFGPHSLEVEDMTYRTDLQLAGFTKFLDEKVGSGKWTLLLTSDHGVAPIPEFARTKKLPATRGALAIDRIKTELEDELKKQFNPAVGSATLLLSVDDHQIHLRREHPALAGMNFDRALRTARDWLLKQPQVVTAFTREELHSGSGNKLHEQLRKSFHARRSGDVFWVMTPYSIPGKAGVGKGTTHGSPWFYDTHVPLLLLGCGIQPGQHHQPVSPACIASTVAHLVSVSPPAGNVEQPLRDALSVK